MFAAGHYSETILRQASAANERRGGRANRGREENVALLQLGNNSQSPMDRAASVCPRLTDWMPARTTSATKDQSAKKQPMIDIEKFRKVGVSSAEEIVDLVGPPAASYTHRGTEHWLYPNAVKAINGEPACPEILLENGESRGHAEDHREQRHH